MRNKQPTLLFVDVLGVKRQWRSAGSKGAKEAFLKFHDVINLALKSFRKTQVIDGIVESDSAAILCAGPKSAIKLGRTLFSNAFRVGNSHNEKRLWLRGVIVPYLASAKFRDETPFSDRFTVIRYFQLSDELLDAIAAEKAGFRGMRLLISGELSKQFWKKPSIINLGDYGHTITARRLDENAYPRILFERGFKDILWMISAEPIWTEFKTIMAKRLRLAITDPEEIIHAGITASIFSQAGAIVSSQIDNQSCNGDVDPNC
jgi:hypothetical protein